MDEINLYDLMRFYGKKWLTIVSFALFGAIIGIVFTFFIQKPTYKSSATVVLVGTARSGGQESPVLNNYIELFTSRRVLESVIAKHNYNISYESLASNTTATNAKNTDIINLSLTTSNADTSKAMLESAIQEFTEQSKALYGDGSIRVNIMDGANLPKQSANVKSFQQIIIAIVSMSVLSIIILFFVYDYQHSQSSRPTNKKPAKKKPVATKKPAKKKPTKKSSNNKKKKPTTQ